VLVGDGELRPGRGFTGAVIAACETIRFAAGIEKGKVWIYESSGERRAVADIRNPGYYGFLTWEPAEVYANSYEELMRAAGGTARGGSLRIDESIKSTTTKKG
jgi:hypothetical protein